MKVKFLGCENDGGFGLTVGGVYDCDETMMHGRTPMCMVKGLWRFQSAFEPVDDLAAPTYTPNPASPIVVTPKETIMPPATKVFTRPDSWSYSRWATWEQCPFKYKKQIVEKIKEEKGAAQLKGITYHDDMAAYLMKKPGHDQPPATKFGPLMAELREFPPEDKIIEEQMGFTREWKPTGWFSKGPNATWLRVIWDVGLLYEDLTGEVCDHKTGKMYGTNMDQMELFAVSFFQKYSAATAVTTRLWYHEHGKEDVAEFKAAEVPGLIKKWDKRAEEMLSDEVYPMKPNDKCKWCQFAKSAGGPCRFG